MVRQKVRGYSGKRLLDLALAVPALILASPVIGVLAAVVAATIGRPVIFAQPRPGLGGKVFRILKFRTMNDARDPSGALLCDGQRLTRLGRLMRVASLDELPELWNVIKGEMSLVGPRPLREEYLLYYTEREQLRHDALPGISGLAQVSGRNLLRWEDRLELDVQYVEQVSFALDLWIIWKTLAVVFRRQGAAPDSAAVGETRLDEERGAKLP